MNQKLNNKKKGKCIFLSVFLKLENFGDENGTYFAARMKLWSSSIIEFDGAKLKADHGLVSFLPILTKIYFFEKKKTKLKN